MELNELDDLPQIPKRLYNPWDEMYSSEGRALAIEIDKAISPIMRARTDRGFSIRDVGKIAMEAVELQEAKLMLLTYAPHGRSKR